MMPPWNVPLTPAADEAVGKPVSGDVQVRGAYRGALLGPELEFFVVKERTLRPWDGMDALAGPPLLGEAIKPGIAREQVELVAPPTWSLGEMERFLTDLVREVRTLLKTEGACLLPLALYDTVPFTLTEAPRYRLLLDVFGEHFWTHARAIVADQVNVGAADEAQAFRVFEAVTHYLPLFMALSVASPFLEGRPTRVASNRMTLYDACASRYSELVGLPPPIDSLCHYNLLLERQPVLHHPNMFYRYARPMPQRGVAAEVRCIDKQPTLRDFMAFVALSKAIAVEATASDRIYTRDGLETSFAEARRRGVTRPRACKRTLDRLRAFLDEGEQAYLDPLYERLISGSVASVLQRRACEEGYDAALRHLAAHYLDPAAS
jgi:gamma-glutamyl:cysteine ligase YbdK (ATP-grasp superfamily)